MSWNRLPDEVKETAERVLPEKQLEAWKYELAGMSQYDIAYALGISRPSVQSRLREARRNLRAAGVTVDDLGNWTIERRAA